MFPPECTILQTIAAYSTGLLPTSSFEYHGTCSCRDRKLSTRSTHLSSHHDGPPACVPIMCAWQVAPAGNKALARPFPLHPNRVVPGSELHHKVPPKSILKYLEGARWCCEGSGLPPRQTVYHQAHLVTFPRDDGQELSLRKAIHVQVTITYLPIRTIRRGLNSRIVLMATHGPFPSVLEIRGTAELCLQLK